VQQVASDDAPASRKEVQAAVQPIQESLSQVSAMVFDVQDDLHAVRASNEKIQGQINEIHEMLRSGSSIRTASDPPQLVDATADAAILFGKTGQSLRAMDDPSFRGFIQKIAPTVVLPSSAELRARIVDLAAQFRDQFGPDTLGTEYVSLMVDGVSIQPRTWLGVSIAGNKRSYFLRLCELDNQKSDTMADALADVVTTLQAKGFSVCAIVTDNAANEVAAVAKVAKKTGIPLFRVACISHTINLAAQDVLKVLCDGGNFFDEMVTLYRGLPTQRRDDEFFGVHTACPTRWLSLGKFVADIVQRLSSLPDAIRTGEARAIFDKYDFVQLHACLFVLNNLLTWTEARDATIPDVWGWALTTFDHLRDLHERGNRYASEFALALRDRLFDTADMGVILLGYVCTPNGLNWYRQLPDRQAADNPDHPVLSQESAVGLMIGALDRFCPLLTLDPASLVCVFRHYLLTATFNLKCDADSHWAAWKARSFAQGGRSYCYRGLSELVHILLFLPCSEVEVERAFSRLRLLHNKRRTRMKTDLIQALLTIQINQGQVPDALWDLLEDNEEPGSEQDEADRGAVSAIDAETLLMALASMPGVSLTFTRDAAKNDVHVSIAFTGPLASQVHLPDVSHPPPFPPASGSPPVQSSPPQRSQVNVPPVPPPPRPSPVTAPKVSPPPRPSPVNVPPVPPPPQPGPVNVPQPVQRLPRPAPFSRCIPMPVSVTPRQAIPVVYIPCQFAPVPLFDRASGQKPPQKRTGSGYK
jgi:hypothetical protein